MTTTRDPLLGHRWVGADTNVEHCMLCRISPSNPLAQQVCIKTCQCECGRHVDEHQPGGVAEACEFKRAKETPP